MKSKILKISLIGILCVCNLNASSLDEKIRLNKVDDIIELLNNGYNIDKQDEIGDTMLIMAVQYNKYDIVNILLSKGANILIKNNEGFSAIMYSKSLIITKLLISHGVNVNDVSDSGMTALHTSIFHHDDDLMKYLIEHGANTHLGKDLLQWSIINNNYSATKTLLEEKNDISLRESINNSFSIFTCVMHMEDTNIFFLLINNGCDLHKVDNSSGRTILHYAARNTKPIVKTIIDVLVKDNININSFDNKNNTPLHEAVKNNNIIAVNELLKYKAKTEIKNKDGKTPLDIAKEKHYTDLIEVLSKYDK